MFFCDKHIKAICYKIKIVSVMQYVSVQVLCNVSAGRRLVGRRQTGVYASRYGPPTRQS